MSNSDTEFTRLVHTEIEEASGTRVSVQPGEGDAADATVHIQGLEADCSKARQMVLSLMLSARGAGAQPQMPVGGTIELMHLERDELGAVIGREGRVIKGIESESGARIQRQSTEGERTSLQISGSVEQVTCSCGILSHSLLQVQLAKQLVQNAMNFSPEKRQLGSGSGSVQLIGAEMWQVARRQAQIETQSGAALWVPWKVIPHLPLR